MSERRYNEDEVSVIFQRAAESQPPSASQQGLTLTELQEIGLGAGIPAEAIALAAQSVDRVEPDTTRKFLGFPLGVAHSVPLRRPLTDQEWERVVVDLRETFDAKGQLSGHGSLHQWTNGNLQVLLEPTSNGGQRLRLRTLKSGARELMTGGMVMGGTSLAALTGAGIMGALGDVGAVSALSFLAVMGAGMFGVGSFGLPNWARTRREQMVEVAERAALLAEGEEPAS